MFGYMGLFALAWFLGWAFFALVLTYILVRALMQYEVSEKLLRYLEHLRAEAYSS